MKWYGKQVSCEASNFGLLYRKETKMYNYKGQKENYPGISALNKKKMVRKKSEVM